MSNSTVGRPATDQPYEQNVQMEDVTLLRMPKSLGVDITLGADMQGTYLQLNQNDIDNLASSVVLRPHEVEALIDFWLETQGGQA